MGGARNYLIVTASYWSFTLTDGALRMLVLLHFYSLGYTPFMLASLFLLYEAAGIFANLGGGWLATRFGIPRMLAVGLVLQIGGLLLLSALNPAWGATMSVAWVVMAQGISGVAKDVTKTASKSAIKATSEGGAGQLFRWVAWFTGSKNAMKGFGFFVGGFLLEAAGFRGALWLMAAMLAAVLVNVLLSLPAELGKAKASKSFGELFAKSRAINLLACRAHLPVRVARRLVCRRLAGLSLQSGVEIHRGGRLHRRLDHRLWVGASDCPDGRAPQPRWVVARNTGSAPLGRGPDRDTGGARADAAGPSAGQSRFAGGRRSRRVRFCFRGDFVAALLSDPRLCRDEESGRGCWLLLRGECRRPADRHPVVGTADPIWQPAGLFMGFRGNVGLVSGAGVSAPLRC